jgi:hypothetical protein
VAFVSLSANPEEAVRAFLAQGAVTWPCGYGVPMKTFALWGAYDRAALIPGYDLKPTLYVLGRDGRVFWHDRHARLRHEPPEKLAKELEAEIELALSAPADGD